MTNDSQNNNKDDEVLAQLYKAGAKETPPTRLDNEILQYAANSKKPSSVSSHFGGGWKVPLSLAACLVLVFGLLVQLEQSDQQFELPPMPEISKPNQSNGKKSDQAPKVMESIATKEDSSINGFSMDESPADDLATEPQTVTLPSKEKVLKKVQPEYSSERQQLEEQMLEPSKAEKIAPVENMPTMERNRKSSSEGFADKPESIQNQTLDPGRSEPALNGSAYRSDQEDLMQDQGTAASGADSEAKREQEFAPIPVEDWLLMIEKLIARKDYAEAARQLQKFKQAHPKVNVDDLDAKIP